MEGKKFTYEQVIKSYGQVMLLREERTVVMPMTMKLKNLKVELEALTKNYSEEEKELIAKHGGKLYSNGSYDIPPENFDIFKKELDALKAFEVFVPFLPLNFTGVVINWSAKMIEEVEPFLDPAYVTKLGEETKPIAEA